MSTNDRSPRRGYLRRHSEGRATAAAGRELVEGLGELGRQGRTERVIGVGMDSTELGVGPQNILVGLDVLGLERIDHGIAVMEDPALVRRMAADRVPLTVCPNSNMVIANRFPSLREHPFRAMREAGLLATLNTDDPAMTDLDLGKEYRSVAEAQGLDFDDLVGVALDGIEASWLDDIDRRVLSREFTQALEDLRPAPAQHQTTGLSADPARRGDADEE